MDLYGQRIASLELVPLGGGVFEVFVDGELIFSKKASKRHAEPSEIVKLLKKRR